jgi:hypothetical protein
MSKIILPQFVQSAQGSFSLERLIKQTMDSLNLVDYDYDFTEKEIDIAAACYVSWKEVLDRAEFVEPSSIVVKGE